MRKIAILLFLFPLLTFGDDHFSIQPPDGKNDSVDAPLRPFPECEGITVDLASDCYSNDGVFFSYLNFIPTPFATYIDTYNSEPPAFPLVMKFSYESFAGKLPDTVREAMEISNNKQIYIVFQSAGGAMGGSTAKSKVHGIEYDSSSWLTDKGRVYYVAPAHDQAVYSKLALKPQLWTYQYERLGVEVPEFINSAITESQKFENVKTQVFDTDNAFINTYGDNNMFLRRPWTDTVTLHPSSETKGVICLSGFRPLIQKAARWHENMVFWTVTIFKDVCAATLHVLLVPDYYDKGKNDLKSAEGYFKKMLITDAENTEMSEAEKDKHRRGAEAVWCFKEQELKIVDIKERLKQQFVENRNTLRNLLLGLHKDFPSEEGNPIRQKTCDIIEAVKSFVCPELWE